MQERCFKLPGVRSCRNQAARPFPFPNLPFGESTAPRAFGGYGHGPVVGLPGRGGRAARARGPVPHPASHQLPRAPAAFQPGLQPGLAREAKGGGGGGGRERFLVRASSAHYGTLVPRSSGRPSLAVGSGEPTGERAGGSANGSARRRRPPSPASSPASSPAPPQPWRSAAPSLRRSAGTRRGARPGPRGARVGVARPTGLAARSRACSPRPARPAGRAAARRFFVSAVASSPALHAHAPAPGAPTKGTGVEATALTHPSPPLTAPRTPRPPQRLRTHACTGTLRPQCKVMGCGTWEHPTYPWARWAFFLWPQRKMDDPTRTGLYAWA